MRRFILCLSFLSVVLTGCLKEVETEVALPDGRGLVIYAESSPLTKADIDKGKSTWEPGDEISVIYEGKVYIYKTGQNGNQVTFISENGIEDYNPSKRIIAFYPPVGVDENVSVLAEQSIDFKGENQINSSSAPLVGLADEGLSPDGALKMSFRNICSVLELRIDAGAVSDRIKTLTVEPASVTGFEGYLSFTGTVDPSTLAITPSSTGSAIKLNLPETASLDRPLTLKIPVGRFKSPSGLKLTVEGTNGNALSRVVYSTGVESYSEVAGVISVKHLAKPLYPFVLTPPEAVDLGLSVMWASCNVGATSPEEYGNYYAWGETETKSLYNWENYKFRMSGSYDSDVKFSKYNTSSEYGVVDNKIILDSEDDVACIKLGGNWRMPTFEELDELLINCAKEWTTYNGKTGYKFTSLKTGYTDNWIFLPATGTWASVLDMSVVGSDCNYWTSSLYTDLPKNAYHLTYNSESYPRLSADRFYGLTVRPVLADASSIPVASISIEPTALLIEIGKSASVTATIRPSNATNQLITWSSSDPSIATVDQSGKVTAVKEGEVNIIATCEGRSTSCPVMVKQVMPSGPVDLGLSVPWASCNLGASSPEEYGDYYAWGEIATKTEFSWSTYKWGKSSTTLTKYNTSSSNGTVDNLTELQMADDAAHTNLGDKWRMATSTELQELLDNCTSVWVTYNGVNGRVFSSDKSGYTDKWIFFPASGGCDENGLVNDNIAGRYWTSSLNTSGPPSAWALRFTSKEEFVNTLGNRYYGRSVRPVYGEIPASSVSIEPATLTLNKSATSTLTAKISPSNATNTSVTWSSSNTSVATVDQSGKVTAKDAGSATITVKTVNGITATCSLKVEIPVSSVSIEPSTLTLNKGATSTLTAKISPSNATNTSVTWSSSNTSVATVDQSGKVTAKDAGSATITVKTVNGKKATCSLKVIPADVVDLGLSVYWGTCNLGSSSPEQYGNYYAWGETSTKSSYTSSNYTFTSNPTTLPLSADAARVAKGGNWRMPTLAEFQELIDNCTSTWTTLNGKNGRKFTSKKSGYTDKWIFFSAAGTFGSSLQNRGTQGRYWTSSIRGNDTSHAEDFYFSSGSCGMGGYYRYNGRPIRPVYEK